jgi:hypothetical protein
VFTIVEYHTAANGTRLDSYDVEECATEAEANARIDGFIKIMGHPCEDGSFLTWAVFAPERSV